MPTNVLNSFISSLSQRTRPLYMVLTSGFQIPSSSQVLPKEEEGSKKRLWVESHCSGHRLPRCLCFFSLTWRLAVQLRLVQLAVAIDTIMLRHLSSHKDNLLTVLQGFLNSLSSLSPINLSILLQQCLPQPYFTSCYYQNYNPASYSLHTAS